MSQAQRVGAVFAGRLRNARKARGWTQQALADAVTELGHPINRVTIAKIEDGKTRASNVTIEELLVFAAALDMPPSLLLVPLGTADRVAITPTLSVHPDAAMQWFEGEEPLLVWNEERQRFVQRHRQAWLKASEPLHLHQRFRQTIEDLADREHDVKAAELVGDERQLHAARERRVAALEALGEVCREMTERDMRPPAMNEEWATTLHKLGFTAGVRSLSQKES